MGTCPGCGTKPHTGATLCDRCREKLPGYGPPQSRPQRSRLDAIVGGFAIFVIIATLAALIFPKLIGHTGGGPAPATADVKTISDALEHFRIDTGRYPTDQEGLSPLLVRPRDVKDWEGPYIDRIPIDPWGDPYRYHWIDNQTTPFVGSDGPDRKPGTDDDITNQGPGWTSSQ